MNFLFFFQLSLLPCTYGHFREFPIPPNSQPRPIPLLPPISQREISRALHTPVNAQRTETKAIRPSFIISLSLALESALFPSAERTPERERKRSNGSRSELKVPREFKFAHREKREESLYNHAKRVRVRGDYPRRAIQPGREREGEIR